MNEHARHRLALGASAAVIVYALTGFLIAPLVIRQQVTEALTQQTGRDARIGKVRFNPFTLTAALDDLTVGQPSDSDAASVRRITARLNVADFFRHGWRARTLTITGPQLTVPTTAYRADSWLPRWVATAELNIGTVTLAEGVLHVGSDEQTILRFDDLQLSLRDLTSAPGRPAEFALSAAIADSASVTLAGSLALSPMTLDARLDLEEVDVGRFNLHLGPTTKFVLSSGVLAAQARVMHNETTTTLTGDATLRQVMVVDANAVTVFEAEAVTADMFDVQPSPVKIAAGSVRVQTPTLHLGRDVHGAAFGSAWLDLVAPGVAGALIQSGQIEIADGRVEFMDAAVSPPVSVQASGVHGSVTQANPLAPANMSLVGSVAPGKQTRLEAHWEPAGSAHTGAWRWRVEALDATALSPYLRSAANHDITGGTLGLTLEHTLTDNGDAYDYEIMASQLQLVRSDPQLAAPAWPLDLAQALLEDGEGNARLVVTVPAHPDDDSARVMARLRAALGDAVRAMALRPFDYLAQLAGVPGENLAQIEFDPGSAALTTNASARLHGLATALSQRRGLGIEALGHFGPEADRGALARQQMRQHIALASGVGDRARAARDPVDLTDPKVISIIEEFAGERLHDVAVTAIAARHPEAGTDYYAALLAALVDNETVSRRALNNLARFRARTVVGELVAAGIAPERLAVSRTVEAGTQPDEAPGVGLRATDGRRQPARTP